MGKREELEKQLEELKEKLREEKKRERIKRRNEYIKENYKRRSFYVPKELAEDKAKMDYYIFLKLAKELGVKTFKRGWEIYYVDKELERLEEQRNKDEE